MISHNLVIKSSSWSVPKPNECNVKTSSYLFRGSRRLDLKVFSAPLSCPSERRNIDVTLFVCLRYLIVFKAIWRPLLIFVPPPAWIESTVFLKNCMFSPETHFNPQRREALLLKVTILNRSEGVKVSSKNLIVSFTNYIFSPLMEPLLSITQIRSTLVRLPPLVLRLIMAGRSVWVLSFTSDLCAFISIYIFASFFSYFTLSTKGSSSL